MNAAETHETFHWESGMRYQLALIGPIHGRIGPVSLLRSDPRTSRIPVVALSALPLDAGDDWFLDAGFAGYVVKPSTPMSSRMLLGVSAPVALIDFLLNGGRGASIPRQRRQARLPGYRSPRTFGWRTENGSAEIQGNDTEAS